MSHGYEPALVLDPSSEVAREGKKIALLKLQKQPQPPQQPQRSPPRQGGASAATPGGAGASSASEAGGAASPSVEEALGGDGMSQLFSFFNDPEVARMAESVAASFVSGDGRAVQEAQAAMGCMFGGGIDVDAALSAVGMKNAGGAGGGGGGGPADAPGAAGGSAPSGEPGHEPGAVADLTRLIDDPGLLSTLGDLAISLSAPQPPASGCGATKPAAAGASGGEPNGASSHGSGGAGTVSNGKARASRQD